MNEPAMTRTKNLNLHTTRAQLLLDGMDCSDCEIVLEHRLGRLDGVLDVEADFTSRSLQVEFDRKRINHRLIEKKIRQMGYEPEPGRWVRWWRTNWELTASLFSGLLLLVGWLYELTGYFPAGLSTGLYLAAFVPAGIVVGRGLLHSLRQRHFDTDLLMFAAAIGAASLGEFAEGGLLLFLFALGHSLQERALDKARSAVRSLGELTPRMAVARREGQDRVLPVHKLTLEDIVVVRAGERLPVDGRVVTGRSYVDESPITGESIPVEKSPGAPVFAGSLNADGALEVQVSRLAKDSTLARVMKMVEQAQAAQSPAQLWVERFTRVFVPVVLVIFLGLIAAPLITGEPFKQAFLRAVTFLVATSPCALALGTPSAVLAGIAQAARNGVLVKGGVYLELLGRMRAVAFDKTGTLTQGAPQVTDIAALPDWTEEAVLARAASVESRSSHPLAKAITRKAAARGISIVPADSVENLPGLGMQAKLHGRRILVGGPKLWKELRLELPGVLCSHIQEMESKGKTIILVAEEDQTLGLIAVADALRVETASALRGLAHLGIEHTMMLSGDNPRAAAQIASQLGLTEYKAELMPDEKLAEINALVKTHRVVGMVGDGVNDAPALAQASVGIALGSAKNDIALEAADVALMAPDLCKLPFAVGLGRAVQRVIGQNLAISIASIVLLSLSGLAGLLQIGPVVFLHEGTTLLVVINALRLFRFDQTCTPQD